MKRADGGRTFGLSRCVRGQVLMVFDPYVTRQTQTRFPSSPGGNARNRHSLLAYCTRPVPVVCRCRTQRSSFHRSDDAEGSAHEFLWLHLDQLVSPRKWDRTATGHHRRRNGIGRVSLCCLTFQQARRVARFVHRRNGPTKLRDRGQTARWREREGI